MPQIESYEPVLTDTSSEEDTLERATGTTKTFDENTKQDNEKVSNNEEGSNKGSKLNDSPNGKPKNNLYDNFKTYKETDTNHETDLINQETEENNKKQSDSQITEKLFSKEELKYVFVNNKEWTQKVAKKIELWAKQLLKLVKKNDLDEIRKSMRTQESEQSNNTAQSKKRL